MHEPLLLSVVIPLYNEAQNIPPLLAAIEEALAGISYEIICVDDGSTDGTAQAVRASGNRRAGLIAFERNFGQTAALAAGIDAARASYIATLDGDLQNDPADIPLMLQRLIDEQWDLVAGWRVDRRDNAWGRKLPSRVANALMRWLFGVPVHDQGCTLKVFRAPLAKRLELQGELHRFIPLLASFQGARIAEMAVRHHPRRFGVSKYGMGRILRVASDLLLLWFLGRYRHKPMHFFGGLGIGFFLAGMLCELALCFLAARGKVHPFLFNGGLACFIIAVQCIGGGFIAELAMRSYYAARGAKPYVIKEGDSYLADV